MVALQVGATRAEIVRMEETRRRPRPLRIILGIVATLGGAAVLGLTRLPAGNSLGIPPVAEADRPLLLGVAGLLLIVAIWFLLTAKGPRAGRVSRRSARRRSAQVDDALFAPFDDEVEVPAFAEPAPAPIVVATPPPPAPVAAPVPEAPASAPVAEAPAPAPAPGLAAADLAFRRPPKVQPVLHRLRGDGWYVADSVQLSRIDIDHVAVGPAGVLTVQVVSTDARDASGLPLAKARVAAEQFQRLLLSKELDIEVVPAMLVWGPNLERVPGGVAVVDAVAVLSGKQADEWMGELAGKELLERAKVTAVRDVLADIVLGGMTDAPSARTAAAS